MTTWTKVLFLQMLEKERGALSTKQTTFWCQQRFFELHIVDGHFGAKTLFTGNKSDG